MNKRELAIVISNRSGISQQEAMDRLDEIFNIIAEQLIKHEEVKLRGFGTFKASRREEKLMINPRTKQEMKIPERYLPVFIPGKSLKDSVRGGKN